MPGCCGQYPTARRPGSCRRRLENPSDAVAAASPDCHHTSYDCAPSDALMALSILRVRSSRISSAPYLHPHNPPPTPCLPYNLCHRPCAPSLC